MTMLLDGELEQLGEQECRRLISRESVGRVGFTVGSLPAIIPVRCALVDGDIVFRAAGGARVRAAMHDAVVAFEVDGVDDDGLGWSVLAVGRARELEHEEERARAVSLELAKGGDDDCREFVRLRPELLQGRRVAMVPSGRAESG